MTVKEGPRSMKFSMPSNNQILSWIILIGGAIFSIMTFPFILLLVFMPFWKPDEVSFLSMVFTAIPLAFSIMTFWAMRRAYKAIRNHRQNFNAEDEKTKKTELEPVISPNATETYSESVTEKNRPVWPWVVIVPSILLVISMGPGAIMLPIMPLFLAGMSTDSGQTPDYVPFLIILIGYGLLAGFALLLFKAVYALRRGN